MPNLNPPNSILFPSEPSVHPQYEPLKEPLPKALPEDDLLQELSQGQHVQKKLPGAYKRMAKGLPPLEANIAEFETEILEDEDDWKAELPPDFALIGTLGMEPKLLDDVLSRPHAKEWQTALNYKIGQLQKLSTWVIEDLPKGHTAIPCSTVLKEKHGPDGEITSYWVCIVTSGH